MLVSKDNDFIKDIHLVKIPLVTSCHIQFLPLESHSNLWEYVTMLDEEFRYALAQFKVYDATTTM